MGDSGCLMHSSFSYTNLNHQGNHVQALENSISFGRFTSESLDCEKWSNVPQKRYVEEAKSYTQPGSVAAKKAFFEAYYKRIAAQKAAAEALLEQEKAAAAAAAANADQVSDTVQNSHDSETIDNNIVADTQTAESLNNIENFEDRISVSISVDSRKSQSQSPLLKSKPKADVEVTQPMIRRKPAISSLLSSIGRKPTPTRIPPSPSKYAASVHHKKHNISTPRTKNDSIDKKRSTPKSLKALSTSSNVRESCKLASPSVQKAQSRKLFPSIRTTPMKTPSKAFINGMIYKQSLVTPSSVNKRVETPVHPTAAGSKSTGPKWSVLSAVSKSLSAYKNKLQSPTISSPFVLRTEERAARRKQKLEEKFNEKAQGVQEQAKVKDKAETEFRRLRQSFCFKARPLPDFYKTPEENPKSFTPRRAAPSFSSSQKKKSSRRLWKNSDKKSVYSPLSSVAGMTCRENISPHIHRLRINMDK